MYYSYNQTEKEKKNEESRPETRFSLLANMGSKNSTNTQKTLAERKGARVSAVAHTNIYLRPAFHGQLHDDPIRLKPC